MAGETVITVVGNLTADPELEYTSKANVAMAKFTVASTPRNFDRQSGEYRDGETLFMRCTAFREMAENAASSLKRGMRVIVRGNLSSYSFQDEKTGERRSITQLTVDEIGPSLRYASAEVTRNPPRGQQAGRDQAPAQNWSKQESSWSKPEEPVNSNDGWANPGQSFDDAQAPF